MGLKQDIVIVNEYTVKTASGKGTRGSSPGDYVIQYMLRDLATETVAPIRKDNIDDFLIRYVLRENATEKLSNDIQDVKKEMKNAQGLGGVAFGYGQFSLSDKEVRMASADIQRQFDSGKVVMKTVLSFNKDYLIKHNIVNKDVPIVSRGDYRGNIDQMKLRLSIMNGLEAMGRRFSDMRYIGVIQVDTLNVHCHLAIVDAGLGRKSRRKDKPEQRGTINGLEKRMLRRGINNYLEDMTPVKYLSSAIGYDRRNVATFVKKWAHERMLQESLPQFLLACLPENRSLWRANTNRKEMRKANTIARELVEEVLKAPESPMSQAMTSVTEYANTRAIKEGLSESERKTLIENGYRQIIDRGVNGIYSLLKSLPKETLQVRTPMLDVMSLDYETVAKKAQLEKEDDIIGFSFRFRSYSQRLRHHRKERKKNHDLAESWLKAEERGVVDSASVALFNFYRTEAEYHAMLASKYEYFLPFPDETESDWLEDWDYVNDYAKKLQSLEAMRRDRSLMNLKNAEEAERIGLEIYGQRGGRFLTMRDKSVIDDRIQDMKSKYANLIEDLKVRISGTGQIVQEVEDSYGVDIVKGSEYEFSDVRSLDLHNMGFDFSKDVPMDDVCRTRFVLMSDIRMNALSEVRAYLEASDQLETIAALPVKDIVAMSKLANTLRTEKVPVLKSEISKLQIEEYVRRSKSINLTNQLSKEILDEVDNSIREISSVEDLENSLDSYDLSDS